MLTGEEITTWMLYHITYRHNFKQPLCFVSPTFTMAQSQSKWVPPGQQLEQEFFNLREWQQLFMDVSSCTGPITNEELQAVMLGGELDLLGDLTSSSTFAA